MSPDEGLLRQPGEGSRQTGVERLDPSESRPIYLTLRSWSRTLPFNYQKQGISIWCCESRHRIADIYGLNRPSCATISPQQNQRA